MKKDFNPQWWQKDCSIIGLFKELKMNDTIAKYTKLEEDILSLKFHLSFIIKIKNQNGYFNTYINDKYDYNIEEQDIYNYIEEIVNDKYVIIEYNNKIGFIHKRYFDFILKEKFLMSKLKNIKKVRRVFTINKLIYGKN